MFRMLFLMVLYLPQLSGSNPLEKPTVAEILARPVSIVVDQWALKSNLDVGLTIAERLSDIEALHGSSLTIRDCVTSDFYEHYLKLSAPHSPSILHLLRQSFVDLGIPLNLTAGELADFEANPTDPLFTRIRDLNYVDPLLTSRLESDGIYFVVDVVKRLKYVSISSISLLSEEEREAMRAILARAVGFVRFAEIFHAKTSPEINLNGLPLSVEAKTELADMRMNRVIREIDLSPKMSVRTVTEIALADLARKNPGTCADILMSALLEIQKIKR